MKCQGRLDTLQFALENVELDGLILEFGVYTGRTINRIAKFFPDKTIFGFDSFDGLPEDWIEGHEKGKFSLNGELPKVKENVRLIKGKFEDILWLFFCIHSEIASFINFDADLYSSTKFVLDTLITNERIVAGTILYFDEFLHPNFNGEFRAYSESGLSAELLGYYINIKQNKSSFVFRVR